MTWNDYQRRVNQYNQAEWRAWDRTRIIAHEMHNHMREKPVHYREYLPLPTDAEIIEKAKAAKLAADLQFLEMMKSKGRI